MKKRNLFKLVVRNELLIEDFGSDESLRRFVFNELDSGEVALSKCSDIAIKGRESRLDDPRLHGHCPFLYDVSIFMEEFLFECSFCKLQAIKEKSFLGILG